MTMSFLALANLHALDFAIIGVLLAIVAGYAIYSQRFTRSVADFLSANRCAGRYLLTVAAGVSGMGAICWASGVLNYGIFPAVTARFLSIFSGYRFTCGKCRGWGWS